MYLSVRWTMDMSEPMMHLLAPWSTKHLLLVFQILDRRELDFDFDTAAQFTDLESGQQHFIDPRDARARRGIAASQ